ncbi:MAG: serine protease [Bdellovibrionota bacterium]
MRNLRKLVVLSICSGSGFLYANFSGSEGSQDWKVIYGADERVDAELHSNVNLKNLSHSVAGRLSKSVATSSDTGVVLPTETLQESMGVCQTERFSTQKTAVECTGFLVGADLLVTAGHCMKSQSDCEQNLWIFGFVDGVSEVKNADVYSCKEIVSQELSSVNDFAVVRLDRTVEGREPLTLRKEGAVSEDTTLAVIGHPSGLPLKIDDGGKVRQTLDSNHYFVAELDTYGGNSGSPVFNLETLEVEGILVRGERDYVWDSAESCAVSNVCDSGSCRGEDVQRITAVSGL